jgi:hypothetical protein
LYFAFVVLSLFFPFSIYVLPFLPYIFLFYFIYRYFRTHKNWSRRFVLLTVLATVYGLMYVPSLIRMVLQEKYQSKEYSETYSGYIDASRGVFIPHFGWTESAKNLLLYSGFRFVEMAQDRESLSDRRAKVNRWSLHTDPSFCWRDDIIEKLWRVAPGFPGLLAYGACVEVIEDVPPQAGLRLEFVPSNGDWLFEPLEAGEYRAWLSEGARKEQLILRETSSTIEVLSFPLTVLPLIYYVPKGFFAAAGKVRLGPADFHDFATSLDVRNIDDARTFPYLQTDKEAIGNVIAAASSENPYLRYAAAYAMCELKETHSTIFDPLIAKLKADPYYQIHLAARHYERTNAKEDHCHFGRFPHRMRLRK